MIYCYYSADGILRETIYERVSVGDIGQKIAVYFENYTEESMSAVFKRLNNTPLEPIQTTIIDNLVIPYDANRDYKYFKDDKPYRFYIFTIPDECLTVNKNLVTFKVQYNIDDDEEIADEYSLGLLAFNVENQVINTDPFDDYSEFAYLKHYIGLLNNRIPSEEQIASWNDRVLDVIVDNVSVKGLDKKATINNKQDKLNTAQMNAVNSGITSNLVSSAEGHIADSGIHITSADRLNWNSKQSALSTAQIQATESGITAGKVSNYDNHIANNIKHITSAERTSWNAKLDEVNWGDIGGTLASQTDLKAVLDDKQAQINNLKSIGRFLSLWNCNTGLPTTNPTTELPYTYHVGDYYRISVVGTSNNKIPNGTQYTGTASTTLATFEIKVGDIMFFDGSAWSLQKGSEGGKVLDVLVNGVSVVSDNVAEIDLTNIYTKTESDNIFALQTSIPTKVSDLTNDSGFITASYHDNTKQDSLSTNQLNATNSGITSSKVSGYDTHVADSSIHVSSSDKTTWNNKQSALSVNQLNATNSGITSTKVSNYDTHTNNTSIHITASERASWNSKQNELESGVNIKTINNQTLLGSGNINITAPTYTAGYGIDIINNEISVGSEIASYSDLSNKQDLLVSGSNIKTINNQSLLGSGNIATGGGLVHSETLPQATSSSPDFVNVGEFLFFKVEINWDEPIQDGDSLELTQVYSVNQIDDSLKIL